MKNLRRLMNSVDDIKIVTATSKQQYNDGRSLFEEYAKAINFDAGFINFPSELTSLESRYTAPERCLLIAYKNDNAVRCIAVLKMQQAVAELKRFYVKPEFRQFKIGAKLLESAILMAKDMDFTHLRLEVIPSLTKARKLYESFGFYSIEPYQNVALESTAYMEKELLD